MTLPALLEYFEGRQEPPASDHTQECRVKLDRFEGAWTALITPFAADGTVDWEAFERLVTFQVAEGVTGLVPAGTTGESATLDWDEHNSVIDIALRRRADRAVALGIVAVSAHYFSPSSSSSTFAASSFSW